MISISGLYLRFISGRWSLSREEPTQTTVVQIGFGEGVEPRQFQASTADLLSSPLQDSDLQQLFNNDAAKRLS